MRRKILFIFTALLMTMTAWADETWTSGDCTVTLSGTTLTVLKTNPNSATGAMADIWYSSRGWHDSRTTIKSIIVENGVTSIGDYAFWGCTNVTSVSIATSVTSIGWDAFQNCINLASISIPEGVTTIGNGAFSDCTHLTTVTFAEGSVLKTIGSSAFSNSGLTSIVIPDGVTSIGNDAFCSCSALTSVTLYAPSCALGGVESPWDNEKRTSAFGGTNESLKIYVFDEYVNTYKTADYWSTYANKIEAITIPTREAGTGAGEYWTTYFNNLSNVKMSSGTQVFKVALSGTSLKQKEIDDRIITKGEGVVLKTTSGSIKPAYSASGSATSYSDNDLDGTMTSITNPGNAYVLNWKEETGIGFYKLKGTGNIGANKAYLTYSAGSREFFAFEESTGITTTDFADYTDKAGAWFTLDGRRLQGKPTTKGLYIINGKKTVIE